MTNCFDLQTRRSEIILVLFIDMFYFNVYPNALKGLGYGKLHNVNLPFLFMFVILIIQIDSDKYQFHDVFGYFSNCLNKRRGYGCGKRFTKVDGQKVQITA